MKKKHQSKDWCFEAFLGRYAEMKKNQHSYILPCFCFFAQVIFCAAVFGTAFFAAHFSQYHRHTPQYS
jgi:hypothetical protein